MEQLLAKLLVPLFVTLGVTALGIVALALLSRRTAALASPSRSSDTAAQSMAAPVAGRARTVPPPPGPTHVVDDEEDPHDTLVIDRRALRDSMQGLPQFRTRGPQDLRGPDADFRSTPRGPSAPLARPAPASRPGPGAAEEEDAGFRPQSMDAASRARPIDLTARSRPRDTSKDANNSGDVRSDRRPTDSVPRSTRGPAAQDGGARPRETAQKDMFDPPARPRESGPRDMFHPPARPRESGPRDMFDPPARPRESGPRDMFDPPARPREGGPRDMFEPPARPRQSASRDIFDPPARPRDNNAKDTAEPAPRPRTRDLLDMAPRGRGNDSGSAADGEDGTLVEGQRPGRTRDALPPAQRGERPAVAREEPRSSPVRLRLQSVGVNIILQQPASPQGVTPAPGHLEVIYGNFSPSDPREIPLLWPSGDHGSPTWVFSKSAGEGLGHIQLNHYTITPGVQADLVYENGRYSLGNHVAGDEMDRYQIRVNGVPMGLDERVALHSGDIVSMGIYRLKLIL